MDWRGKNARQRLRAAYDLAATAVTTEYSVIEFSPRRVVRVVLATTILASLVFPVIRGAEATAVVADAALRQRVPDLVHGMEDVPLPLIIDALTGHEVLPWSGEDSALLTATAADVLKRISAEGIEASRVNEAGNIVERCVLAALRENGFEAGRPAGPSGRVRAAGYPDLEAIRGDHHYYVEVKSFGGATINSTQRTFYLSPSTDFKVTRDAFHLLIAVELVEASADHYRAQSVRWLDLSRLRCDLKHEFNASNRDLYDPAQGLEILFTAAPEP